MWVVGVYVLGCVCVYFVQTCEGWFDLATPVRPGTRTIHPVITHTGHSLDHCQTSQRNQSASDSAGLYMKVSGG